VNECTKIKKVSHTALLLNNVKVTIRYHIHISVVRDNVEAKIFARGIAQDPIDVKNRCSSAGRGHLRPIAHSAQLEFSWCVVDACISSETKGLECDISYVQL
jgi:hypothetical protein